MKCLEVMYNNVVQLAVEGASMVHSSVRDMNPRVALTLARTPTRGKKPHEEAASRPEAHAATGSLRGVCVSERKRQEDHTAYASSGQEHAGTSQAR